MTRIKILGPNGIHHRQRVPFEFPRHRRNTPGNWRDPEVRQYVVYRERPFEVIEI